MSDDIAKLGFEIDSTPLVKAGQAAQQAAQQIGQVGTAAEKTAQQTKTATKEISDAEKAAKEFGKSTGEAASKIDGLTNALTQGGQGGLTGATTLIGRGLSAVGSMLGGVSGATVAAGVGVTALAGSFLKLTTVLAEAQDRYQLLESRLKNATGSASAATQIMATLYEQTQKTGLGFQSASDAFLRVARNAEALGATKEDILQLSDTIQKLGKVSGASTGEIQSGMVQLGQALASGRLNGDELRSIMENMPALAKAIADGLGVSVGQIRAMGAAGELTSDKVFGAILKASGKANEEFSKLPDTVSQANQRVADSWDQLLATMGKKWDSSSLVRNSVNWLANLLNGANGAMQGSGIGGQIREVERQIEQQRGLGDTTETRRKIERLQQTLAELRQKAQAEVAADSTAREAKEVELNRAFIQQAIVLGQNEYDDYKKKVDKSRQDAERLAQTIGDINVRIQSGIATDADRAALPNLQRQAAIARAEFEGLANGVDKARKSLTDLQRAQAMGGGGGGTGIVQNAIGQQRDAQKSTGAGGSLQAYIDVGVADAATKAQDSIRGLNQQAEAQRRLAGAVGQSRDAMRELEITQAVADFRFQRFGTLTGPLVEKTVRDYEVALRKSKLAAEEFSDTNALKGMADQINAVAAQIEVLKQGAYAMREAAALAKAAQADLQRPGSGAYVMQEFRVGEQMQAMQELEKLRRENAQILQDTGAIGDPTKQRDLRVQRQVDEMGRNTAPEYRRDIEAEIRQKAEQERVRDLTEQNQKIKEQVNLNRERWALVGMTGERLAVETALLEKRNQLLLQGVDLSSEEAKAILKSTEELSKQQYVIQKAQEQASAYQRVWENAARNIQQGLGDAFEAAFRRGKLDGASFLNLLQDIAIKISRDILAAAVYSPLEGYLKDFGQSIGGSFGSFLGLGGSSASAAAPFIMAGYGQAFGGGNVIPFASGGVVSRPTIFGMASGGTGVAGEAGPEAVLPLRRGNDGRLGVASAGGGGGDVNIQILDQRTNENSKPIEARESTGPDGQRMIQILVRDEVRRAIRSGDLDKDMNASYGNQRRLVTR